MTRPPKKGVDLAQGQWNNHNMSLILPELITRLNHFKAEMTKKRVCRLGSKAQLFLRTMSGFSFSKKNIRYRWAEAYLQPSQTSTMELFFRK